MTSLRRVFIYLFFTVLSSVSIAKSLPDDVEPGDGINEIQLPLNKKSAAELVRIETQGKILAVEKERYKGKKIFKVKTLHKSGKVKNHFIDPQTGRAAK